MISVLWGPVSACLSVQPHLLPLWTSTLKDPHLKQNTLLLGPYTRCSVISAWNIFSFSLITWMSLLLSSLNCHFFQEGFRFIPSLGNSPSRVFSWNLHSILSGINCNWWIVCLLPSLGLRSVTARAQTCLQFSLSHLTEILVPESQN